MTHPPTSARDVIPALGPAPPAPTTDHRHRPPFPPRCLPRPARPPLNVDARHSRLHTPMCSTQASAAHAPFHGYPNNDPFRRPAPAPPTKHFSCSPSSPCATHHSPRPRSLLSVHLPVEAFIHHPHTAQRQDTLGMSATRAHARDGRLAPPHQLPRPLPAPLTTQTDAWCPCRRVVPDSTSGMSPSCCGRCDTHAPGAWWSTLSQDCCGGALLHDAGVRRRSPTL
ncbi:hypothetical protein FA95DRAFT_1555183 [Auriscalpium vulgare]|uniref:Uncharacterized protein n=1 Tax=Auriscalpium vulgare TaxID=40419 RepID=A0ACB8S3N2_9AGAM|nr:hypothetical protein FA95DRAFT_1555183 [Auriscalpium vulgare]